MQLINNSTLYNLSEKRTEIMGVAMLMVIAYHFALHFGFYHSPHFTNQEKTGHYWRTNQCLFMAAESE